MAITEATMDRIDRVREEAVERGEMSVVDDVVTDDYVRHTPGAPEPIHGPDRLKRYKRTLRAGFPDLSVTIEDRIVGENAVVDRYRMQCTREAAFQGIAPTGREIAFTGLIVHDVENGRVTENVADFDPLDLMQQLGAVEQPDG